MIYNFDARRVRRYRKKEIGVGTLIKPAGVAADSFGTNRNSITFYCRSFNQAIFWCATK